MQGLRRRLLYVVLFEGLAITATSIGIRLFGDHSAADATFVAVAASAIAVSWNFVFNSAFEAWEARQPVRGRTTRRRVTHALLFETGLIVFLVPMIAWRLGIPLWEAFLYDLGLMAFFLCYTYGFTLAFDRIFGLPASAQGEGEVRS